jgi:hypothetical protein
MKHTVEKSFQLLMPFVFVTAAMYCLGALVAASWSLIDWTANLRGLIAIWSLVGGFMLLLRLEQTRDR